MSDQNGQRVVVTGIGAVTPVGLTVNDYWDGLINGRSGIRSISLFDPSRLAVRIAGEAPGFDPQQHFGRKDARRMDRFSQFAVVAALEAAANAELAITDENSARTGCVIGTGIGGIVTLNQQFEVLFTR
ncbi:MAG: beta-ketoacyl synthase N-terminal-like domain-containing protein [Dehalococcoidia bacterium]